MARQESAPFLLDLPDECLLAVLQCCAADDQRSVCSTARAHSRLHQAALAALSSITAVVPTQQQLDDVLCYVECYDRHINSLDLTGLTGSREDFWNAHIWELFPSWSEHPSLVSLQLSGFTVQLQACTSFAGVLGAAVQAAALTKLTLRNCDVPERWGDEGLAAAVALLPTGLQHLCLDSLHTNNDAWDWLRLPTGELQRLQQLTYLELAKVLLKGPDRATLPLQPLQALTRLVDLRILMEEDLGRSEFACQYRVPAGMLSGAKRLTRLQLSGCRLGAGALAGVTQLQHLHMKGVTRVPWDWAADVADVALLLSQLQPLQQLTVLCLPRGLQSYGDRNTPATAYAALTASSKLVQLDLSGCTLPAAAWQHMFRAGRQLPHLQRLDMTSVTQRYAAAPDFSSLVSCCPGLQHVYMGGVQSDTGLRWSSPAAVPEPDAHSILAPLKGLSGLHTLHLGPRKPVEKTIIALCQLTGLKQLHLDFPQSVWSLQRELAEYLTQMTQLTALSYRGPSFDDRVGLKCEGPDDEPVWRQLIQRYCKPKEPLHVWPCGRRR